VCVHEKATECGRDDTRVFDLSEVEDRNTSCHVGDGHNDVGDDEVDKVLWESS
jgi:hypothetical protein